MKCQEIQKSLSSYLEGHLSPDEKKIVEEHLSSCAQCGASFAEVKKTRDLLRELDEVAPPSWLAPKIMARVREESAQRASFFKKLFFPFYIKVPIQALTVILVGVIVFQVYRLVEPEKRVARVPSTPSLVVEKKAPRAEPKVAEKPTEALSSRGKQAAIKDAGVVGRDEHAQAIYSAPGAGGKKSEGVALPSSAPGEESTLAMKREALEEKEKGKALGGAVEPAQTGVSEQTPEALKAPDAEKSDALLSQKGMESEPQEPVPAALLKEPPARGDLLTTILIAIITDKVTPAKDAAKDILKQVGGKEIERMTQGTTEVMTGTVPFDKINELSEKLKSLGEVKTTLSLPEFPQEITQVRIEITPK